MESGWSVGFRQRPVSSEAVAGKGSQGRVCACAEAFCIPEVVSSGSGVELTAENCGCESGGLFANFGFYGPKGCVYTCSILLGLWPHFLSWE